ncbi:MAG TPA: ATP-binding protein [Polyangiales bacterium]|nr:ATP-binding protein [Polyangiales bacterium]
MMEKLMAFLLLPAQVSAFEQRYLARMNRVALVFFALHVPVFALIAAINETNPMLAVGLTMLVMAGPLLAMFSFENARAVSLVYGFTAMLMGGLLVHFGQGPVQIEMHFYFFALLAMLSVFANPMVIVVGALTVALHHALGWALVPSSVFNYQAPLWVVAVHAGFVVLESVATCFIARVFFDNVIGLEKIVEARTAQLDARNQDMRLVLDHVQQGLLTVDRDLRMSNESSRVIESWLGVPEAGQSFPTYLEARAPRVAHAFTMGWEQVLADMLPLELALEQLPRSFQIEARHFRMEYTPILHGAQLVQLLIVISDMTAEVEREKLELEQRDVMRILARVAADKAGVLEFFVEAAEQVATVVESRGDMRLQKRVVHTLKGNAMIFGVQTIARMCERMETNIDELGQLPSDAERAELADSWSTLCAKLELLIGERKSQHIEIDDAEYDDILSAVLRGAPRDAVASQIRSWRFEPTQRRLARIAHQAASLAERTGKGAIEVEILDGDMRLDAKRWASFWSAFVHCVRNSVDHGIESPEERAGRGKGPGKLQLSTRLERGDLLIAISDDGRGVNWARVAEKARERGLPHQSHGDLVEALFADGLSTRDEASEYSGRGVGMSAVRASCHEHGGTVTVHDRVGGGTVVEFRFPTTSEYAIVRGPLAEAV